MLNSGKIANNQNWLKESGLVWWVNNTGDVQTERITIDKGSCVSSWWDNWTLIQRMLGEHGVYKICIPNLSLTLHRIWGLLKPNLRDDSVNHSSITTPQIQRPCIHHYSFCNLFPLENQNFHYGTVRLRYQWCFRVNTNVINPVSNGSVLLPMG